VLKITFEKNIYFFGTWLFIKAQCSCNEFYQTFEVFFKTSHPYWSVKRNFFAKLMKNRGVIAIKPLGPKYTYFEF